MKRVAGWSGRVGALPRVATKIRWGARVVGWRRALWGGCRYLGLTVRRPATSSVILRNGVRLEYGYPDQAAHALIMFRDYIDPEYTFLLDVIDATRVVIDVGAAIGQFTTFAAAAGAGTVHAIDPERANIEMLARNVAANGFDRWVSIHQMGLAGYTGTADLDAGSNRYTSTLDLGDPGNSGYASEEVAGTTSGVAVRRLDDMLDEWDLTRVDVLKVNVAGHEHHVLEGARNSLAAGRVSVLILLISPDSKVWYEELTSYGYEFFFLHPPSRTLHRVDRFDDRYLAAPPWPARHLIAIHRLAHPAPGRFRVATHTPALTT